VFFSKAGLLSTPSLKVDGIFDPKDEPPGGTGVDGVGLMVRGKPGGTGADNPPDCDITDDIPPDCGLALDKPPDF